MEPSEDNEGGYRWSCPVCGTSRVVKTTFGPRRAIEGLRAHLEIYEGNGHGAENEFPDIDVQRLDEHVAPIGDEEPSSKGTDEVTDRTE